MPRILSLLLALTLTLTGCDLLGSDDGGSSTPVATGVFVANQGSFGNGNGSITAYDPVEESVQPSAIDDLGSIVQGIAVDDNRLFVAANTGARIDVFDTERQARTAQITGFSSPRYIHVNQDVAYVTDWSFSRMSTVRLVNLTAAQPVIVDSVQVNGLPEAMARAAERLYVSIGPFDGYPTAVAAIDLNTGELAEQIDVGCQNRFVAADGDAEIWVLCSNTAEAVVLNAATGEEVARVDLPAPASTVGPGQPGFYDAVNEALYVVVGQRTVLRINTAANVVDATVLSLGDAETPIGAVAYDAGRESLYLGRVAAPPAGFTEQGRVTIHDADGTETNSFPAGIAPTFLAFQTER